MRPFRPVSDRRVKATIPLILGLTGAIALRVMAADVYVDGKPVNATRVDITTSGAQPTPPVPTPAPTAVPSGKCPPGATVLDKPMSFASNTWGLDGVPVPVGQTLHFCALLDRTVSVLKVRTADRTGPSQCSNVKLTLTSPPGSGLPPISSQAINNTLNRYGTVLSGNVVPPGAYLIDLYGDTPRSPCTSQAVLVYWQR